MHVRLRCASGIITALAVSGSYAPRSTPSPAPPAAPRLARTPARHTSVIFMDNDTEKVRTPWSTITNSSMAGPNPEGTLAPPPPPISRGNGTNPSGTPSIITSFFPDASTGIKPKASQGIILDALRPFNALGPSCNYVSSGRASMITP